MAVPTYDLFVDPVLRVLAKYPDGVAASKVHNEAASFLKLTEEQLSETTSSGQQTYKNRAGWAHDRLKRAGLSSSLSRGKWCLTPKGFEFSRNNPFPLTDDMVKHITFDFNQVLLKDKNNEENNNSNILVTEKIINTETSSPDDQLDSALKQIRNSISEELLENLLAVTPARFEIIVLDVLHQLGYGGHRDDLQQTGGTGDGGIDGIISLDKLGLEKIYVQAKRWQGTVGRPELQAFYGALAGQKAKRGIFITTSSFTTQAKDFAKTVEGMVLIDGIKLVQLMMDNEIGVTSKIIKIPKIDIDYFE